MGKVFIQGLDNGANRVFNDMIEMFESNGFSVATSLHLLYITTQDEDIRSKLDIDFETLDIINEKIEDYICDEYGVRDMSEAAIFEPSSLDITLQNLLSKLSEHLSNGGGVVNKYVLHNMVVDKDNTVLVELLSQLKISTKELQIDLKKHSNLKAEPTMKVIGRGKELSEILEVLSRKNKSNPCLIGEAGVGKTTLLKAIENKVLGGKVPDSLLGYVVINVDAYRLISGTKYRGEMESKLTELLDRAKSVGKAVILIDDVTAILSSSENSNSAASSLKVLFNQPDVKVLCTSSSKDYQRYIGNNKVLARLIQPINIDEPTIDDTVKIVSKVSSLYSSYHNVGFDNSLSTELVKLSKRYIDDLKLPDSAITVLDQTCARVRITNKSKNISITLDDVKETISKISNIPAKDLNADDKSKYLNIEDTLKKSVIGQDNAIKEVGRAIKRGKSGVRKGNRPIASFMFTGPTGVGKTELTKVLADFMFGGKDNIIRLDMSEYMEKHSVSKLIGAPPGYVGYGEGGILTNAIKRKPNSIILLDEIEKAHTDVYNLFLQVLDDGILTDGNGEKFNFKHSVIIMTSNAGIKDIDNKKSIGFGNETNSNNVDKQPIDKLKGIFKPEFLNRIDKIVEFNKLGKESINKIVELLLNQVSSSLMEDNITVKFDKSIVENIAKNGYSDSFGARNLRREVQDLVENYLADLILSDKLKSGDDITLKYKEELVYEVNKEVEYSA